jgi:hypothetical protein
MHWTEGCILQSVHIDRYIGKLIVEAAQNVIQERNPSVNKLE